MFYRTIFSGDSMCLHLEFLRGQTEVIFKVKVLLDLKIMKNLHFLSAHMRKYLNNRNVNTCFST